jgi:hypothetical protein
MLTADRASPNYLVWDELDPVLRFVENRRSERTRLRLIFCREGRPRILVPARFHSVPLLASVHDAVTTGLMIAANAS